MGREECIRTLLLVQLASVCMRMLQTILDLVTMIYILRVRRVPSQFVEELLIVSHEDPVEIVPALYRRDA